MISHPRFPVNLPSTERRRDLATRNRVEDSWNDVRSQMDDVIRRCVRVSSIGSGDDVRELIDDLEIEIRRLKVSQGFVRGVANHERIVAQARSRSGNKSSAPKLNASRVH